MTVKDAAIEKGVSVHTVRHWIRKGRLKHYRFGPMIDIDPKDLAKVKTVEPIGRWAKEKRI